MWTRLRLTVLHAEYRAELDGRLPNFKGSTLRGTLGHALKEVSCLEPGDGGACATCTRVDRCAAGALFDIPFGPGGQGGHDRPAPFVLTLPADHRETFHAGARLGCTLTLVGAARIWYPWVIAALASLGWRGLGFERRPWSLTGLWNEGPVGVRTPVDIVARGIGCPIVELSGTDLVAAQPLPASGSVALRFLSPAHLQRDKRLIHALDGPTLLSRLLRRLGSLLEYYEAWSPQDFDFAALISLAAQVRFSNQRLEPIAIDRYSNRQDRKHPLTGLVGSVVLSEIPPELWPYLVLGQWTHIGKGSTFGLGKYTLEPISSPLSTKGASLDPSQPGALSHPPT